MGKRWLYVVTFLAFISACTDTDEAQVTTSDGTESSATEDVAATTAVDSVTYSITLTGAAEVPGPGDDDGSGTAQITLKPEQGEVCYDISVTAIGDATAAHIHTGTAGESGGPVVNLNVPENGLTGCVNGVAGDLLSQIRENPSAYYLNVHTAEFQAGAVRGQLEAM